MNLSSLSSLTAGPRKFFARYHNIVFFIIIAGFIAFTILSIIVIINGSARTDSANVERINSSFDQATINRLNQLESGSDVDAPQPGVRTNPFTE